MGWAEVAPARQWPASPGPAWAYVDGQVKTAVGLNGRRSKRPSVEVLGRDGGSSAASPASGRPIAIYHTRRLLHSYSYTVHQPGPSSTSETRQASASCCGRRHRRCRYTLAVLIRRHGEAVSSTHTASQPLLLGRADGRFSGGLGQQQQQSRTAIQAGRHLAPAAGPVAVVGSSQGRDEGATRRPRGAARQTCGRGLRCSTYE